MIHATGHLVVRGPVNCRINKCPCVELAGYPPGFLPEVHNVCAKCKDSLIAVSKRMASPSGTWCPDCGFAVSELSRSFHGKYDALIAMGRQRMSPECYGIGVKTFVYMEGFES